MNPEGAASESAYTVEQTAAYFAARLRAIGDALPHRPLRASDVVSLTSVAAFLDRIAAQDLSVFAAGSAAGPA